MGVEEKPEEEVKLSPTTIFINGLPPTFSNDDLKTHFDKFGAWKKGEVSFRAKRSRGFAFIDFEQESAAVKAREEMNGKEVAAGAPITVLQARERSRPSKEKKEKPEPAEKREKPAAKEKAAKPKADAAAAVPSTTELFVKNLPPTFVDDDLEKVFAVFGPLKHSYVCWRRDKHRGYGFVKFDESAHAAAAAEKLNGQTVGGGDKPLRVEFSTQSPKQSRASKKSASKDKENATGSAKEKKPREPREPKTSAAPAEPRAARAKAPKAAKPPKVVDANAPLSKTMLFVGGLPETIGTDELKAKFEKFGELSDAFVSVRGKRHRGFGFATFTTEASAKAALDALNGKELPESKAGKPITVTYAREKPTAA